MRKLAFGISLIAMATGFICAGCSSATPGPDTTEKAPPVSADAKPSASIHNKKIPTPPTMKAPGGSKN